MVDEPDTARALAHMRASIDALDHALVNLLAERRMLVSELFAFKERSGLPLFDPARERDLLAERALFAEARGVPAALAERVFRAVLDASHETSPATGKLARGDQRG